MSAGARYYDPHLARWNQRDPLNQPADLRQPNRYIYVGGDPINRALRQLDGEKSSCGASGAAASRRPARVSRSESSSLREPGPGHQDALLTTARAHAAAFTSEHPTSRLAKAMHNAQESRLR